MLYSECHQGQHHHCLHSLKSISCVCSANLWLIVESIKSFDHFHFCCLSFSFDLPTEFPGMNSLDLVMVITLQHSLHKCKVLIYSCSPLHELSISIWACTPKIGTNPSNSHPKVVTEESTCSGKSMGLFKNHYCYQGCDLRTSECTGKFLESTYNRSTPHSGRCCTF